MGDTRGLFIGWHHEGGRAPALAEGLGFELHCLDLGSSPVWYAPIKYLRLAAQTIRLIQRSRPDMVIVTNPPIVTALVVYLAQLVFGGKLVIDSHTGAFVDPRWEPLLPLHRWLSKRAHYTLVHNSDQARIVESWGVRWLELGYVQHTLTHGPTHANSLKARTSEPNNEVDPTVAAKAAQDRPYVLAACAGAPDEPLDAVAIAGRSLPHVDIFITGKTERIHQHLSVDLPENVKLLGYIDFGDYLSRLDGASAVLALTTREKTLLNGAFEAMAASKPLITSDSRTLQDFFHRGTVFTDPSPTSIANAIDICLSRNDELSVEMKELAEEYHELWEQARVQLIGEEVANAHRPLRRVEK